MKRIVFATLAVGVLVAVVVIVTAGGRNTGTTRRSTGTTLTGAGSTFVAPLVARWSPGVASAYGYEVQYSPIGSGGGITAVTSRTVDFGASDAPLSSDQFAACKGCVQIPWALSATSVVYNVRGAGNTLHMTGPVLAQIFAGKITQWNAPAIRRLNKDVSLPSERISVVHRSDNSGTTYNFTDYLSSVSPAWKAQVGRGVAVSWPTGIGGKGSSGVAAGVSQTPGAIGYVDVAYALNNHLTYFAIANLAGAFTTPGLRGIKAAASADRSPDANGALSIVNPPKQYALAYPISTFTYAIVPTRSSKAPELRKLLSWVVTKGQAYGPRLLFQPLPRSVLVVAERNIAKIHA